MRERFLSSKQLAKELQDRWRPRIASSNGGDLSVHGRRHEIAADVWWWDKNAKTETGFDEIGVPFDHRKWWQWRWRPARPVEAAAALVEEQLQKWEEDSPPPAG